MCIITSDFNDFRLQTSPVKILAMEKSRESFYKTIFKFDTCHCLHISCFQQQSVEGVDKNQICFYV